MRYEIESEKHRIRPLLAIGAAALLGLTACGSDEPESSGGSGDSTVEASGGSDEPTAEASSASGTSPEDPLPMGATVQVYGWEVSIADVQLDATDSLREHFSVMFQEPAEGHRYAVVTLEGTWVGEEDYNAFYSEVLVRFHDGGTEYAEPCAVPAPGVDWTDSIPQGESITSAWCVVIPEDLSDGAVIELRDYVEWVSPPRSQYFFETP